MTTDPRIMFLGCWAALSLAGCGITDPVGMSDPGQDPSGGAVPQNEGLASQQDGEALDRAALTALYEAAGGKNWSRQDKWLTNAPLDDWYGVQVSRFSGRVTGLRLPRKNLKGKIPPELGNLTDLEVLWLTGNRLEGNIPSELGNLKELRYLWLDHNRLTGPIPRELGNLTVRFLELQNNRLTGRIPAELGDIGYVNGVGHRHTPVILNLAGNRLRGAIPGALGKLVDLQVLALERNRLTGEIPAELGNLKDLTDLTAARNRLSGKIPQELGGLWRLDVLDLGRNRLTGRIPSGLFDFHDRSCFVVLDLGDNQLQGPIPKEIGSHTCLEDLRLDNNKLRGRLPATVLDLGRLDEFHFGDNRSACAPNTAAFVDWLKGIESRSGPFCK